MEIDPKQSPLILDFENGEMMARLLAAPDMQPSGATPAAATPPATFRNDRLSIIVSFCSTKKILKN